MSVFDQELFGPVRCLKAVHDLDEAIAIVNRSSFGHSAVIYTESGHAARHFARRVNVGQVGVNVGTPAPIAFYPVRRPKGVLLRHPSRASKRCRRLLPTRK